MPSRCGVRSVAVLAETDRRDELAAFFFDGFDDDALTLAQRAEDRSLQGPWTEEDLRAVIVQYDYSYPGDRIVGLDDTLAHVEEIRP